LEKLLKRVNFKLFCPGTNERKVIEILCSKDAKEVKVLCAAYKKSKRIK